MAAEIHVVKKTDMKMHLCLGVLGAHARSAQFDHVSELCDGFGRGLGRLG